MNIKLQQTIGAIKLGAKRNAPELLLGLGLVTGTACVALTGRASVKAAEIQRNFVSDKEQLDIEWANHTIVEEEGKVIIRKMYTKYALDLAKEYAIPVGLYAATVASVFASYKIQKNRNMALSAALTACTTAYASLLGKLRNGAAAGLTAKEVMDGIEAKITTDENGIEVVEKVQGEAVDGMYAVRFDKYSPCWEDNKWQNEATLRAEQNWANDRLTLQGYVFLNDIYHRLGLPPTIAGQMVGWAANSNGDGYVDFGIKDAEERDDAGFDYNAFDLEFNVDGDILNVLKK